MQVRRQVLGDEHVDRAMANATPLDADFQRWITESAWGGVWSRPGLDRRTRSLVTLAILAALGIGGWVAVIALGLALALPPFYALFDRERQFIHDRLLGTRLVSV